MVIVHALRLMLCSGAPTIVRNIPRISEMLAIATENGASRQKNRRDTSSMNTNVVNSVAVQINSNMHDNNAKLEGQCVVGKRPIILSATGSCYTTFRLIHPWALAASRLLTNPGAVTSHSLSRSHVRP